VLLIPSGRSERAMNLNRDALEKIRSEDLRADAMHLDGSAHTVLVEVGVPLPTLERSSTPSITNGRPRIRIGSNSTDGVASVDEARKAVEQALGHKAQRYLPSSRTFIVEATGRELCRIAELPAVVAIWPNTARGFSF
jgi:hypothetical protein